MELRGFRRIEGSGSTLWVDPEFSDAARALDVSSPGAFDRTLSDPARTGGSTGREPTTIIDLPDGSSRLHLRRVVHGGWLGPWLGGRLAGLSRPASELGVASELRALGAPVPRPALMWAAPRGCFWRVVVGTVFVERAVDIEAFLRDEASRAQVASAARAAGRAVRRFHDLGGSHADLHVKNLLLRPASTEMEAYVVDLDRSKFGASPTPRRRMAELMRLYRSLVKRDLLQLAGTRGCAAFLGSYCGGDRALRHSLMARLPIERRVVALHRIGYRLRPNRGFHAGEVGPPPEASIGDRR